jgi:hypothetical protein
MTYKAIHQERHAMRLVVHPGTEAQKWFGTAQDDRPAQVSAILAKAREKYPSEPLAWLTAEGETLSVIP